MKKLLHLKIFVILICAAFSTQAQIAAWNFFGTNSSAFTTATATTFDAGLVAAPILSRGAGATASAGGNSFRTVGFQNNGIAITNIDYFEFSLKSNPGKKISLSGLSGVFGGTATYFAAPGVTSQFAYSIGGAAYVLIGTPSPSTSLAFTVDLSSVTALQNLAPETTISFRYYASGQTTTGGWGFTSANAATNGLALSGTVENVPTTATTLTVNPSAISFGSPAVGTASVAKNTTITYSNLTTADLNFSAPTGFTFAKTEGGTYSNALTYTNSELTGNTSFPLFIKYTPTVSTPVTEAISITGGGLTSAVTIDLSGTVYNPYVQDFNDASFLTNSGWSQVSVSGTANNWIYTATGPNTGAGAAVMNGFSDTSVPSNDWLISPSMDLSTFANFATLQFYSREFFNGPDLKLMVSTTYNGSGTIVPSEWTEINGKFPSTTAVWQLSENINLETYKSTNTRIAFVYQTTAGGSNNSSEWKIDDFKVENKATYAAIPNQSIGFPETAPGNTSTSANFSISAGGYGNITVTAPNNFQVSLDNTGFANSVVVTQAEALVGKTIFTRFAPASKSVMFTDKLAFTGNGLNISSNTLSGSSILRSETFDVASYNLEFFGSDVKDATNIEFGPTNDALQVTNVTSVLQKLNLDVIAVQEVSDIPSFNQLLTNLPGYAGSLSNRWSRSFEPPSSTFPAQQMGFIYNTATVTKVSEEPLFITEFDAARGGNTTIFPNYPTGDGASFWASGRLPFMTTFTSNINGNTNTYRIVVIHGKSGGSTADHNRKAYDNKYLYDYLNATYPTDKIIILGDFNDKVVGSISTNPVSSYDDFVSDVARYSSITKTISQVPNAGTYVGGSNPSFIDHIIISNELNDFYISNSITVEDPRSYISSYSTTTSDHLPIYARFLTTPTALPVSLINFSATPMKNLVNIKWATASEVNNDYFTIERSSDGKTFTTVKQLKGAGNSNQVLNYTAIDYSPFNGVSYYHLKQTDFDGKFSYSDIRAVKFTGLKQNLLSIYPNPVVNQITLSLNTASAQIQLVVSSTDGKIVLRDAGSITALNEKLNKKLAEMAIGVYIVQLTVDGQQHRAKFIKQ